MNHKWGDLSLTEITGMTRAMTVELLIFRVANPRCYSGNQKNGGQEKV